ncbi:terminase small subunit [Fibrella forsythiae]|uniref:Terminase small subunit n=1 Tax=Fibrella forsythiae TaxID=2817061 RepID=A0ABS3JBD3_9BACT|nr:terminase small subunit [Fibrella forsythiae]MBO0947300.1 terminase small subunit [Fibrella forsythiae]
MTKQQERFVEAFARCLVRSQAAIQAGYSAKSAKQRGYELMCNPEIRAAVNAKLLEMHVSWEEAAYRIGITARSSLNDCLIIREVIETRMVRRPLQDLIDALQLEHDIEQTLFEELGMGDYVPKPKKRKGRKTDEEADEEELHKLQDEHFVKQQERKMSMRRYQIELRFNPDAYRDVAETVKVREVSVDFEKLRDAETEGRIKKLTFDKKGRPQIELYPADRAQETILKLNGKLPSKETDPGFKEVDISGLSEEMQAMLVELARLNRQS